MGNGGKLVLFGVSTLLGAIIATVILMALNASLLRVPDAPQSPPSRAGQASPNPVEQDYKAITERNLFRARLQAEIPKAKTEKEAEEEILTAAVKAMTLKGVMLTSENRDNYAVIDLGGQKGVWTYEVGEIVEKGLALKEIGKDSIRLEKGEFTASLRLFSPVAERMPGSRTANAVSGLQPQKKKTGQDFGKIDIAKEIRKEGSITLISKSLAERLKVDNNMVMSSISVKATTDGLKVVTVDKGSIAQKMGIVPDDTLKEINGHRLSSSEDMNRVYEALKNASAFEVKVWRSGKQEILRYEIR
jgi:type II secretory pathway component PulC